MAAISFSGVLQNTGAMNNLQNFFVSNELKINQEWSLVGLYSTQIQREPKILEIRRKSTSKEVLVSGTFKLVLEGDILQRKFVQLIEAGFATTQIELNRANSTWELKRANSTWGRNNAYIFYEARCSIDGSLKFSACESNEEYSKGIQVKSLLHLSDDLVSLLDPELDYFSDVNIKCGSVSFPAHKNILSARSDVFAAMFASQMKENRSNKVDITDLSPAVLKIMLTYIYTGKTGELSVQSAGELLFAADKYQLLDLKRVCSDYLKSFVSAENVLRTLVLGDLHDKNLKVFAMDFICNSCEEFEVLEKTVEWRSLREKKPALTMDVLTRLVKSKDQKLKSCK